MDKKEYKIEVGKRIKTIILEKYSKQCAFSAKTGISEVQISKYVNGDELPDLVNLSKIVKATNISADYILFGEKKERILFEDDIEGNNEGRKIIKAIAYLIKNGFIYKSFFVAKEYCFYLDHKQAQCVNTLCHINDLRKKGYNEKNINELYKDTFSKYSDDFKPVNYRNIDDD